MSTTAGIFNETTLQDFVVRADEIMLDTNLQQDYIPRVDALKALVENSTPDFSLFKKQNKKTIVEKVIWPNFCEIVCDDNTPCVYTGPEPSTNAKDYTLRFEKQASFTVIESEFKDNYFGMVDFVAKATLTAKKVLAECFSDYALALLNSYVGPNHLTGGMGTVVGNATYIPSAMWDQNTIAYLMRAAKYNQFGNAFGLSGSNLLQQYILYNQLIAKGDYNQAGQVYSQFKIYFDEFNIDTINTPDKVTYLINKGSYGIANKAWEDPTWRQITGDIKAHSETIPYVDLDVDVYQELDCNDDMTALNVKVKLTADMFQAPTPCDDETTGMLLFVCGSPTIPAT
jgi:hypothetical protein